MEEQITNNIPDGMGVTTEPAAESIAVPAAESVAESLPEGQSATDGAGTHVGLSDEDRKSVV